MDDIDTLPLPEKLAKLLRMVAMGRLDAAAKLAEVLSELLGEKVISPEAAYPTFAHPPAPPEAIFAHSFIAVETPQAE